MIRKMYLRIASILLVILLVGSLVPAVTFAEGGATITQLELFKGNNVGGELVANLMTDTNPTLEPNQEYYLVITVTKNNANDDCWVSIDLPYWMEPINRIGGEDWNKPDTVINHTVIDKVLRFDSKLYDNTFGNGSSNGKVGAGKVWYHICRDLGVAEPLQASLAISFRPSRYYWNGNPNGHTTTSITEQLAVACGVMNADGVTIGAETDSKRTTNITRKTGGWLGITMGQESSEIPTVEPGDTITVSSYLWLGGTNSSVLASRYEFDVSWSDFSEHIDLSGGLPSINYWGSGVNVVKTPIETGGITTGMHVILTIPSGQPSGDGRNLSITSPFLNTIPEGIHEFSISNVKGYTYGDLDTPPFARENNTVKLKFNIGKSLDIQLGGTNSSRFDWLGEQGFKENTILGAMNLTASGPSSLAATASQTIYAQYAKNAIVRTISLPKFDKAGTDVTITMASGITFTGPLADVAKLANTASYAAILNTDIPGVVSTEDSITSVTYVVGSMSGGSSSSHPSEENSIYSMKKLACWGSFANKAEVVHTYEVWQTGTDPTDPNNTTYKTATSTFKPVTTPVIPNCAASNNYNLNKTSIIAGETVSLSWKYMLNSWPYTNTLHDNEPTFYLILPKGIGYGNFSINGTPVVGLDVTTAAAAADEMTIWQFASPKGTSVGIYGIDGKELSADIKVDLLTVNSLSPMTLNIRNMLQVGNKDYAADSQYVYGNGPVSDKYIINKGLSLRAGVGVELKIQELKAVYVDNAMRVTSNNGSTYTPWAIYNAMDHNNTVAFMNQSMSAEYRVTVTNKRGDNIEEAAIFVPIPKTGNDFGSAFNPNGPFEFNLFFNDKSIPTGFKTTYVKMNSGSSYTLGASAPKPTDYVVTTPSNADMVIITIPETLHEGMSADIIFNVTLPALINNDYGLINIWNVVPTYKLNNSYFMPTGYPEAMEIAAGIIKGTVYEDYNGNGVMDNDEKGKANVTVTAVDSYNPPRILVTTTDSLGNYIFTNVRNTSSKATHNENIEVSIIVTNPDPATYDFSPTTLTGNKPSVVTSDASNLTATKSGLLCVALAPVSVDAGLVTDITLTYVAGFHGSIGTPSFEELERGESPKNVPDVFPDTSYYFKGWSLNKPVKAAVAITIGTTSYGVGQTIPAGAFFSSENLTKIIVMENTTATAVFEGNLHSVKYTYTGTVPPAAPDTAIYNMPKVPFATQVTLPSPSVAGWTFNGWVVISGGVNISNNSFTMPDSDVTFQGSWTENVVPPNPTVYYTVIFMDWNGTVLKSHSGIPYGGAAIAPENPSRTGYTFIGWSRAFNFVTSSFIVTAQYSYITPVNPPPERPNTRPPEEPTEEPVTQPPEEPTVEPVTTKPISPVVVTQKPEEVQEKESINTTNINTPKIPLFARGYDAWSLLNLILVILGIVFTTIQLIKRYIKKKNDEGLYKNPDENDNKTRSRLVWFISTLVLVAGSIIFFLLTEDISLPIVWLDIYSIFQFVICALTIFTAIMVARSKNKAC